MQVCLGVAVFALLCVSGWGQEKAPPRKFFWPPLQVDRSLWPQEPYGFKGVGFGFTKAQAKKVKGFHRAPLTGICFMDVRFGQSIDEVFHVYLRFVDDQFVLATGNFPSQYFADAEVVFKETYGPPLGSESPVVQNRMGAQFQGEVRYWKGSRVSVVLGKYGSDLDSGLFGVGLSNYVEQLGDHNVRKDALK